MLYEAPGPIHQIRVAPDGASVAFWEVVHGTSSVAVIDRSRQKRSLSDGWLEVDGLAWTANGRQIWFAGKSAERGWGIYAVSTAGELRLLLSSPGPISLQDLSPDGRALICRHTLADGNSLSSRRCGPGEGAVVARRIRPRGDVRRRPVAAVQRNRRCRRQGRRGLHPSQRRVAGGQAWHRKGGGPLSRMASRCLPRHVRDRNFTCCRSVSAPGGRCPGSSFDTRARPGCPTDASPFVAMEQGHDPRVYVQSLDGTPHAISPEGLLSRLAVSPDGQRVMVVLDRKLMIVSTSGGAPQMVRDHPRRRAGPSAGWTATRCSSRRERAIRP